MARRIGWRLPLSAAAVAAMTLAFMYVLTMGTQQSDLRHRARVSLEAEAAQCESLQAHGDRALCRAALHALPRDSADIVAWTPRDR